MKERDHVVDPGTIIPKSRRLKLKHQFALSKEAVEGLAIAAEGFRIFDLRFFTVVMGAERRILLTGLLSSNRLCKQTHHAEHLLLKGSRIDEGWTDSLLGSSGIVKKKLLLVLFAKSR